MIVSWFSGGVSSAIATWLMNDKIDKVVYIHIDNQHNDTLRFVKDFEKVLGREIEIIQSPYKNVESVIKQFRYVNGPYGAKCTEVLKRRVRKEYEIKNNVTGYVWGFDSGEVERMERIKESNPEYEHYFPLHDEGLTKAQAHGLLIMLEVQRPLMYDQGYSNNNCLGCVKGGMWYWNKIRVDYPEVFERMSKLEREIGATVLKDKDGKVYLDELEPNRGRKSQEIVGECSIYCSEEGGVNE